MSDMVRMVKAGLLFGFTMALKERADAAVARLRKAQRRKEAREPDGMDELRRPRRRKPAVFILR